MNPMMLSDLETLLRLLESPEYQRSTRSEKILGRVRLLQRRACVDVLTISAVRAAIAMAQCELRIRERTALAHG
jgi:hypothetical protein